MEITGIINQRQIRAFTLQYEETVGLERALGKIIAYLRKSIEGKALDWQDRGCVERAVSNLATTQAVLAARLSRHSGTMQEIEEMKSA